MNIVALGSFPFDLEFACLGTLSKFIKDGHEVHMIIAKDKAMGWTQTKIAASRNLSQKIGVSQVYFADGFDCSAVIQDNVVMLGSFLKKIDPSLVIMPFWKATNQKRKILAKTSLIACRGIGSVLMYEFGRNSSFLPTVYFAISPEDTAIKRSYLAEYGKLITEPVLNKKTNFFSLDMSDMKKYPFPLAPQACSSQKSRGSLRDNMISQNNYELMLVNGPDTEIEKLEHRKNDNGDSKGIHGHIIHSPTRILDSQRGDRHELVEVFESHRLLLVDTNDLF